MKNNINKNLLSQKQMEEKKKEADEKRAKIIEEMKSAFNRIFSTKDGQLLGKWLMGQCNFVNGSVVMIPQKGISLEGTLYNEARRGVYLELRHLLNEETLINLEIKR